MKVLRIFRIKSLSRAEAMHAEAHRGMLPADTAIERLSSDRSALTRPGRIEIMLMSGLR